MLVSSPCPFSVIPAGAAATILTHRGGMRGDGSVVLVVIGHVSDQGFNIYKLSKKKHKNKKKHTYGGALHSLFMQGCGVSIGHVVLKGGGVIIRHLCWKGV